MKTRVVMIKLIALVDGHDFSAKALLANYGE